MSIFKRIFFLSVLLLLASCKIGRFVFYNFSDITDYKIFPSRAIQKSDSTFYFTNSSLLQEKFGQSSLAHHIDSTAKNNKSVAFLVIRNDSILFEKYYQDYTPASVVASFSTAKSYVSALVGIAIAEGHILSIDEKMVKYIPELSSKKGFDQITIKHLLQMTSGIKSSETYYSPFSDVATLYYGTNLTRYIKKLKLKGEPGKNFEYVSVNTQLLAVIVERATKQKTSHYLEEKIWKPLGMQYDATWSLDKKNGMEKAFCCLNARAIDYAKFGRLYLNHGNWNGKQIIPASWVKETTKVDTQEGSAWYYQYQWWLPSKKGDFSTSGYNGQFIYVNPGKKLLIVRLGKREGKVNWMGFFREIASKL